MNFFQQLAGLNLNGDLQIVMRQDANTNELTVLVQMTNHKAKEGGLNIPPLKLNGSALAVDQGFFEKLSQPVANVINSNIDDFLSQMAAHKSSALKKNGVTTTSASAPTPKPVPTSQEIRKQKFDKIMADIDKLIGEKKFKEATAKLPKSTDWPEFPGEIMDKKALINRSANEALTLFAGSPTLAPPALPEKPAQFETLSSATEVNTNDSDRQNNDDLDDDDQEDDDQQEEE